MRLPTHTLIMMVIAAALLRPAVTFAQRPDTARTVPKGLEVSGDSITPPISPRKAFFMSFLLPGYSQSKLGRNKAAAAFVLVETMSLVMIRESAADVHEARRTVDDTVVVSYIDPSGNATTPTTIVPRYSSTEVHTRLAHVEDWLALLVANHLFSGADAFVAAHLWDVPSRLGLRLFPHAGGAALTGSLRW
jgi:hypothetical protein